MQDQQIRPSNRSIDKVGDILKQISTYIQPDSINNTIPVVLDNAIDTIALWRSLHSYPLNLIFKSLKKQIDKLGNNVIYGQRLKRLHSIIGKITRLDIKKLSTMQDIGGCRVVFKNYDKLRKLCNKLHNSKTIKLTKDYITYPKNNGYRGMHLVYICNSKNINYNGLQIEIQLRTKLQHAWATTVEIIDLFESQDLKIGQGDQDWREFFYLVGEEFAIFEQLPLYNNSIHNRIDRIKALNNKLNVLIKLSHYLTAIGVINQLINSNQNTKYAQHNKNIVIVLRLFTKTNHMDIDSYQTEDQAQAIYTKYEKEYIGITSVNILMVTLKSIKELKKAYPNYFADSTVFVDTLSKILQLK